MKLIIEQDFNNLIISSKKLLTHLCLLNESLNKYNY